jgi:hypothetical protein
MDAGRTTTVVPINPDPDAALRAELEAMRTRARYLAATPGLSPEHRALARAGRIVLGLEAAR